MDLANNNMTDEERKNLNPNSAEYAIRYALTRQTTTTPSSSLVIFGSVLTIS